MTATEQPFRLVEASLGAVDHGQAVEAASDVGMVPGETRLPNLEGAGVQPLRVVQLPSPAMHAGQVGESRRQLRIVRSERCLLDDQRPLEDGLRLV
jgi:hypothetical protein